MAKIFGSQIDLQKIPIKGIVAETQPTASKPAAPVGGQLYYDTTSNNLYVYVAGAVNNWIQVDNQGLSGSIVIKDEGVTDVAAVNIMDFVGAGVDITPSGQTATVNINGAPQPALTGGDITGTWPTLTIGSGKVTSTHILDGTVLVGDLNSTLTLDNLATNRPPTASVALNSQKITGLANGTASTDGINKSQLDAAVQGLAWKDSVKAATPVAPGNITLSGTQTIDGIALVANDRCLVKNQTTPSANGIYLVQSGAWTRAPDMDADTGWNSEIPNATVFVEQGTTLADTAWTCTADQGGTLGTTSITWVQFGAGTVYTAGTGITISTNTISIDDAVVATDAQVASAVAPKANSAVVITAGNGLTGGGDLSANRTIDITVDTNTLTAAADLLSVKYNTSSLTSSAGGLSVQVAPVGGLSTSAAPGLCINASYVSWLEYYNVPALVSGVENTIVHNFGTADVQCQFIEVASGKEIVMEWRATTALIGVTCHVVAGYAANALRVIVTGRHTTIP